MLGLLEALGDEVKRLFFADGEVQMVLSDVQRIERLELRKI